MRWERSFIPIKLSRRNYLVLSLDNYAIELCAATDLTHDNTFRCPSVKLVLVVLETAMRRVIGYRHQLSTAGQEARTGVLLQARGGVPPEMADLLAANQPGYRSLSVPLLLTHTSPHRKHIVVPCGDVCAGHLNSCLMPVIITQVVVLWQGIWKCKE